MEHLYSGLMFFKNINGVRVRVGALYWVIYSLGKVNKRQQHSGWLKFDIQQNVIGSIKLTLGAEVFSYLTFPRHFFNYSIISRSKYDSNPEV